MDKKMSSKSEIVYFEEIFMKAHRDILTMVVFSPVIDLLAAGLGFSGNVEGAADISQIVFSYFRRQFYYFLVIGIFMIRKILVQVEEDPYHFTRDPHMPIQAELRFRIHPKRPEGLQYSACAISGRLVKKSLFPD
jgi:uncharacterized membrane protein YtjA (UPF0391 family)